MLCSCTKASRIADQSAEEEKLVGEEEYTTFKRNIGVFGDCSCVTDDNSFEIDKVSLQIESSHPLLSVDYEKRFGDLLKSRRYKLPSYSF